MFYRSLVWRAHLDGNEDGCGCHQKNQINLLFFLLLGLFVEDNRWILHFVVDRGLWLW